MFLIAYLISIVVILPCLFFIVWIASRFFNFTNFFLCLYLHVLFTQVYLLLNQCCVSFFQPVLVSIYSFRYALINRVGTPFLGYLLISINHSPKSDCFPSLYFLHTFFSAAFLTLLLSPALHIFRGFYGKASIIPFTKTFVLSSHSCFISGLAPVAGMCTETSSCTVNEGRHFESVYVVAHEIGHK